MAKVELRQIMRGEDGKLYYPGEQEIPKEAGFKFGDEAEETDARLRTGQPADTDPPEQEKGTELPIGFPSRKALIDNELTTMEAVDKAKDEELLALGLKPADVQKVRAAVV